MPCAARLSKNSTVNNRPRCSYIARNGRFKALVDEPTAADTATGPTSSASSCAGFPPRPPPPPPPPLPLLPQAEGFQQEQTKSTAAAATAEGFIPPTRSHLLACCAACLAATETKAGKPSLSQSCGMWCSPRRDGPFSISRLPSFCGSKVSRTAGASVEFCFCRRSFHGFDVQSLADKNCVTRTLVERKDAPPSASCVMRADAEHSRRCTPTRQICLLHIDGARKRGILPCIVQGRNKYYGGILSRIKAVLQPSLPCLMHRVAYARPSRPPNQAIHLTVRTSVYFHAYNVSCRVL